MSRLLSAVAASLVFASLAAAAPPLEYEGISAATSLVDLNARFPGRVDMISDNATNPKHPVSASIRFDPWLGRSHYMDYYEIANELRVICIFFVQPGTQHPQNDEPLRCEILRSELEQRFGKAPKIDQSNEEALHHTKHIWTQRNRTMTLDCANLPGEPLSVDRLMFECHGTCR